MNEKGVAGLVRDWLSRKTVQLVRSTGVSDELGGFALKAVHFGAPWLLLNNAALASSGCAIVSLAITVVVTSAYCALGGCVLSDAERELKFDRINIVDPYVRAFGRQISSGTRVEFTGYGAVFFISAMLVIMHVRGII